MAHILGETIPSPSPWPSYPLAANALLPSPNKRARSESPLSTNTNTYPQESDPTSMTEKPSEEEQRCIDRLKRRPIHLIAQWVSAAQHIG